MGRQRAWAGRQRQLECLRGPAFVQHTALPVDKRTGLRADVYVLLVGVFSMPIWRTGAADQLRSIGVTLLGIVLALIPPALWVAWTETGLLAVIAVGVACAAALVILADSRPQVVEDRQHPDDLKTRKTLSDASIVEIHRIFPLTYHHSLVEKARFRQAMDKIRRMLG